MAAYIVLVVRHSGQLMRSWSYRLRSSRELVKKMELFLGERLGRVKGRYVQRDRVSLRRSVMKERNVMQGRKVGRD